MLRVLKVDGIIVWYDFHMNNPQNPDVRGVKKNRINLLFQDCKIYLKHITLAPPIARKIAPFSITLCQILEKNSYSLYTLSWDYTKIGYKLIM